MTVDHLKMIHSKGSDALSYDPHKYAMDYHSIGFRECAAEVARYLVSVEGLDIQDPLRLRLMSHLQCFAAQRELATKQAAAPSTSWGDLLPPPPPPPHDYDPAAVASCAQTATTSATTASRHSQQPLAPLAATPASALGYAPHHHQYLHPFQTPSTSIAHHQNAFNSAGSKPYRPWGAEVAY